MPGVYLVKILEIHEERIYFYKLQQPPTFNLIKNELFPSQVYHEDFYHILKQIF